MNVFYAQQQLSETCRAIGAIFTLDEAEGEVRACIVKGHRWWNLIQTPDMDEGLWYSQLQQLRQLSIN